MTEFQKYLRKLRACGESREWCGERTPQEAWDQCERADWLLWWAAKAEVDRKLLVRVACQCARLALRFVKSGENRPLKAIETAEEWCEGKATIEEVRAAYAAADVAAYAAAYAAAAYAAAAASYAAAYAAYAAAAAAAYTAAYAAARHQEHLAMCAIVREMIAFELVWQEAA